MAEPNSTSPNRSSGWGLYWVMSAGTGDCFVVARNYRSAKKVEAERIGSHPHYLSVERVLSIPSNLEQSYRRRCKRDPSLQPWPSRADKWLLQKVGAEFREIDDNTETLVNDTVYTNGPGGPIRPRLVGNKAIKAIKSDPLIAKYGEEAQHSPAQAYLLMLLGECVARCQEIEHFIANSFLLGISEKQKRRYNTINDLTEGWKRKTLGQLIAAIEEAYEIHPTLKMSLELFLEMRNKLVHGLTTTPRYDINTYWGQKELVAFLSYFEMFSRPVRKAFRSSFYASIDFGAWFFLADDQRPKKLLTKKQDKEIDLFFAYFTPKAGSTAS